MIRKNLTTNIIRSNISLKITENVDDTCEITLPEANKRYAFVEHLPDFKPYKMEISTRIDNKVSEYLSYKKLSLHRGGSLAANKWETSRVYVFFEKEGEVFVNELDKSHIQNLKKEEEAKETHPSTIKTFKLPSKTVIFNHKVKLKELDDGTYSLEAEKPFGLFVKKTCSGKNEKYNNKISIFKVENENYKLEEGESFLKIYLSYTYDY